MLTCVCMLRYSAHYAVPMLFYFFTFSVVHFWQGVCMLRYSVRHAVPMLFYFFTFSVVRFWQSARMLRYSMCYSVPMLFYFFTFSVVHFRQGARMLRYSMCYAMPILFHFFTFSVIHFWQGACILRYSAHYALRSLALNLSLPPLAVPSPTEVSQPPLPPSHPAQRRWPKTSRAATPISHNRGSHPKPQHHSIHTIRYNSKTSSV